MIRFAGLPESQWTEVELLCDAAGPLQRIQRCVVPSHFPGRPSERPINLSPPSVVKTSSRWVIPPLTGVVLDPRKAETCGSVQRESEVVQ
jgi:hypothetical protein